MTLHDMLKLVSKAYGNDDIILEYFNPETGQYNTATDMGCDTLALFIVRELIDTFEPEAPTSLQLEEARRVVCNAMEQLMDVNAGLDRALVDARKAEGLALYQDHDDEQMVHETPNSGRIVVELQNTYEDGLDTVGVVSCDSSKFATEHLAHCELQRLWNLWHEEVEFPDSDSEFIQWLVANHGWKEEQSRLKLQLGV